MEKSRTDEIKEKRKEIVKFLKEEKITAYEWELLIEKYINQKYKESTL